MNPVKIIASVCLTLQFACLSGLFGSVFSQDYPDSLIVEIKVTGKYAPEEKVSIEAYEGRFCLGNKMVQLDSKGEGQIRISHARTEGAPLTFTGQSCFGHGSDKCNWAIRLTKRWKKKRVRLRFKYCHRNWLNEI